ncbi:MAG: hypothetical protein WAX04_02520, partial [Oscillospiraceae bacterium]
ILLMRKWFTSRVGVRRGIYYIVETFIFKEPGYILSNLTPGHKPKELPTSWKNPFTGEERIGGMDELLLLAEDIGAGFIDTINEYWNNQISLGEFFAVIGNQSYETGLEL